MLFQQPQYVYTFDKLTYDKGKSSLSPHHTHFIFVGDDTSNFYSEIPFRGDFEGYLSDSKKGKLYCQLCK